MSMTFSQMNNRNAKPLGIKKENANASSSDDVVHQIESARNFSKEYSLSHSPEQAIINKTLKSVVFKIKESQLQQTATYHFWKNSLHGPEQYTILVCTKAKELISIVHKSEDLSLKFFKITNDNEVDVIIYDICRP